VKIIRSAGNAGIMIDYVDDNNFVFAYIDGTNAYLIKKVAGVNSTVISGVVTYSADAYLSVASRGNTFRLFYNQIAVGSDGTIADSVFATATKHGLYTSDTTNTFNDFQIWASGTNDGTYNYLLAI
jgi:hypothetical protein